MASIGLFVILIPAIIIVTVVTLIVYKIFYDKHNNRVLESGETNKRKWIAPWGLALIVLGVQLVLAIGSVFVLSLFMLDPNSMSAEEEETSRVYYEYSDIKEFTVDRNLFMKCGQGTGDGITIAMYKHDYPDGSVDYIFTGSVEDIEDESIYFDFDMTDENDMKYGLSTVWPMREDSTTLYYMIRIHVDEFVPAKVIIGVGFGADFDYQRDGWARDFGICFG
jgi:flagellar basal body-associated protein FliL